MDSAHIHDPSDNPVGTDGFEFVEFATTRPAELAQVFMQFGFTVAARQRSKNVTVYRQGKINVILNAEPNSQAERFASVHGPSANAVAFRVRDATRALDALCASGARSVESSAGPMQLPAIEGIGGSLIYLVDRNGDHPAYDAELRPGSGIEQRPRGVGLTAIDHLTYNVERGNMDAWVRFYETHFNFREIGRFDITGKMTGLRSRALISPCRTIRIAISEPADEHSQIAEYLKKHRGEGVQHVALATADTYTTIATLRANGVEFLETPDAYYERLDARVPGHGEDLTRLRDLRILLDGAPGPHRGLLLQIFTSEVIGPLFFEIIQRKGNEGFGEGNFQALFESMELDQLRRGVL